jgi:hypothetical protein
MRPWRDCNGLGKLCIACCALNIYFAFILAYQGEFLAICNAISAAFCAFGTFSNKCKKND